MFKRMKLRGMLQSKDWHQQEQALRELSQMSDVRTMMPLAGVLLTVASQSRANNNYSVRALAQQALVRIGNAAVQPLVNGLRNKDSDVRYEAAEALGGIGDARALDPLLAVLQDPDPSVRRAAVHALGQMGDAHAVEPLTRVLKDSPFLIQDAAVMALAKLGWQPADNTQGALVAVIEKHWNKVADFGEAAVEPLLTLLKDEIKEPSYIITKREREILDCLVKIGSAAVEPLLAALKDATSVTQKKYIIGVLGQIGDARAVEPLVLALKGEDSDVREEAAKILLAQFGDVRALELLLAIFALKYAPGSGWHAELLPDLTKVGDAVIEPLMVTLMDKNKARRMIAAEALGRIGDARALDSLVAALQDPDTWVRVAAAEALGSIGDGRALDSLVAALQDPDTRVRAAAALALGRIGDARALDPLVAVLQDPDPLVRAVAAEALGSIGDADAVEPLLIFMNDNTRDKSIGIPIQALQKVLERSASSIDPEQLGFLAALKNMTLHMNIRHDTGGWCGQGWMEQEAFVVDYTQVRQLARQELIRRGLEA